MKAAAQVGGEEREPGHDWRAEEDEPGGHHPEARVRRVERQRPPHQQRGAAEPHRDEARGRGGHARPRRLPRCRRRGRASGMAGLLRARGRRWLHGGAG